MEKLLKRGKLNVVNGNLWDFYINDGRHPASPVIVTTNGVLKEDGKLVMGKGVALSATYKYPDIDAILGRMVKWYGNKPFYIKGANMISWPTKHDWRYDSSMSLIVEGAYIIKEMIDFYDFKYVYSPWPGCGNGNLDKDKVAHELEIVFGDCDKFIIVEN